MTEVCLKEGDGENKLIKELFNFMKNKINLGMTFLRFLDLKGHKKR